MNKFEEIKDKVSDKIDDLGSHNDYSKDESRVGDRVHDLRDGYDRETTEHEGVNPDVLSGRDPNDHENESSFDHVEETITREEDLRGV